MANIEKNYVLEVANRLREARINAGYKTITAFTTAHDIPFNSYRNHEKGLRSISIEQAQDYSKLLKVHPAWLMTGEDYNHVVHKEQLSESDIEEAAKQLAKESYGMDLLLAKYLFEVAISLSPYLGNPSDKDYAIGLLIHTYKTCVADESISKNRIELAKQRVMPLISLFKERDLKAI